ncbi:hypothetical protein BD770DRAFT_440861 [Pilaira anomala]|nr:hypothetical protein BD770DRAFT_440861 [Pilaira anomala]
MSWDFISTWIKYNEKFYVLPNGDIINKPFAAWTSQHQKIAMAIDYVECVNLSMQVSVFFLLQCFWNYLSNAVAKKSFMSSWEFKFYIFWALGSSAIFPILQWYFRNDPGLRETAPQLAYSIEMLITVGLGIRSNFRFKRLLKLSQNLKNNHTVVEKLSYFKDMNIYLTCVLFSYGISLCTLCVDGLTEAKVVNQSKFAADLLISNCNAAAILMWIVSVSIFHPRRSPDEMDTSSKDSNGMRRTGKNSHGTDVETCYTDKFKNEHSKQERSFMRPMGQVEVDQPRSFTPTHQFSPNSSSEKTVYGNGHHMAVEDPYTNTAVNFTMMDPNKGQRFNQTSSFERSKSPSSQYPQEYPMQTMSVGISNQDDFRFDPLLEESSFDYLGARARGQSPTHGHI